MRLLKIHILFFMLSVFAAKSQTVNLVAESKNNLCLLNHEVIQTPTYTAFKTEKISKALFTFDAYPEAVFVANNHNKLFIANNINAFNTPQYNNLTPLYASPKFIFGNAVVGDMNGDGQDDVAASNALGDIITFKRISLLIFNRDSISQTLGMGGHNARLLMANLNGDATPDLVTIGAHTATPYGYKFRPYLNTSTISNTVLTFNAQSAGYAATLTVPPNDSFSANAFDLNGDNKDEVLFVSEATTTSLTILYSFLGTLDQKLTFDLGIPNITINKIMGADINNDGQKEIVLSGKLTTNLSYIYIYSSTFSGNIPNAPVLQKTILMPGDVGDFGFADMNKDSLPDLVTNTMGSGNVHVYIQKNPAFNFVTPPISFNQGLHTTGGLAFFDADDNKSTDIISFATNTLSSISILKNYTYRDTLYAVPSKTLLCPGDSVKLISNLKNYSGIGYYSTFSPSVSVQAPSHTLMVTQNNAGSFTTAVTYSTLIIFPTTASTCSVISNPVFIAVGANPTISLNAPPGVCNGSSVSISASGANSYTWSTGQTNTPVIALSPTAALSFTVNGKSLDGCFGSKTGSLIVYPNFTASVVYDKNFLCKNQNTIFTAAGGNTYTWSTGAQTASLAVTQTATTLQSYTVTVND
ncbi:MAG: FG-GAP repeat domain-containing protein, partial [Sphingobacteriaceae bacterium]